MFDSNSEEILQNDVSTPLSSSPSSEDAASLDILLLDAAAESPKLHCFSAAESKKNEDNTNE